MGWHLDGRVTAVRRAPTRTSRPPTRACCPAAPPTSPTSGMTGPRGGVIGVKREQALERFITMMPVNFETVGSRIRG